MLVDCRVFGASGGRKIRLKPPIAQPENMIEAVEDHLVMGDDDDRSALLDGDPAQ